MLLVVVAILAVGFCKLLHSYNRLEQESIQHRNERDHDIEDEQHVIGHVEANGRVNRRCLADRASQRSLGPVQNMQENIRKPD